jgi:cell division septum initiation protein DivIVA
MLKEKEDFDNKSSKMLAEQVEAAKGEYIGEMRQI